MKLKFISSLVILVLGLTQFGCSIGSPAVPSAVGSMTAKLNGVNWVSTKDTSFIHSYYVPRRPWELGYSVSDLGYDVSDLMFNCDNSYSSMSFKLGPISTRSNPIFILGDYDLDILLSNKVHFVYKLKSSGVEYTAVSGTLKITQADSASKTISGTFDCVMYNSDIIGITVGSSGTVITTQPVTDSIIVTDGVFSYSKCERTYGY